MGQLIFEHERRDQSELRRRAAELAAMLSVEHGVRAGARVLFILENSLTSIELLFASWLLRAQCIVLAPTSSRFLAQAVAKTFTPQVVCFDAGNERLRENWDHDTVVVGDDRTGPVLIARLGPPTSPPEAGEPELADDITLDAILQSQPEVVFYTSGSTTQAKGVRLTWDATVAKGRQVLAYYGLNRGERVMPILPMSHVYGLYPLLGTLSLGGDVVICRETASPATMVSIIADEDVSIAMCPPLTARFLFGRHAVPDPITTRLRILTLGGAATPPDVVASIQKNLPNTEIFLSYGLAETYSTISCVNVSREPEKIASVGPARFSAELQVRDPETGRGLPAGEIGELCVGGQITAGYCGLEEGDDRYFTPDGWLRTGDLGVLDDEGYAYIKGRIKDVINAGGSSIDPSEIEEVLLMHPAVRDCGVFGDTRSNREFPVVGLVFQHSALRDRGEVELVDELFSYCRKQLSKKLVPGKIVPIDRIPRTTLGKIARASLREAVMDRMQKL